MSFVHCSAGLRDALHARWACFPEEVFKPTKSFSRIFYEDLRTLWIFVTFLVCYDYITRSLLFRLFQWVLSLNPELICRHRVVLRRLRRIYGRVLVVS